jgi:hypothetical protein
MRRRLATGGALVQPKIAARNEKKDVLPDSPVLMMIGRPVAGRFDVFAIFRFLQMRFGTAARIHPPPNRRSMAKPPALR